MHVRKFVLIIRDSSEGTRCAFIWVLAVGPWKQGKGYSSDVAPGAVLVSVLYVGCYLQNALEEIDFSLMSVRWRYCRLKRICRPDGISTVFVLL